MAPSQRNQRRRGRRIGTWLGLAVLIHAELALVLGLAAYFWAPRQGDLIGFARPPAEGESIDISTVDEETARKLIAELEKEEEKAKEEQVKKEIEATEAPGQVVEIPKPVEEKRPDKARFAGEYDSTVEKETKKVGRPDQAARAGAAAGNDPVTKPASPASPPQKPSPSKGQQLAMRPPGPQAPPANPGVPGQPGAPTANEGEPRPLEQDPEGVLAPGGRGAPTIPGLRPGGGAPSLPGSPALVPSEQQLARAIGSGTDDHIEDIDEGEDTALNSKKWKFASFFNRVKQQVREHWKPGEEYRRRDPSGSIYGQKNRYTLLRVQLKADGTLANVMLESSSDVEFLDDVAIQAFREAQPFPNPPKQLVDASGLINFRFGFFFELSGAPRMRIFRYNSM